MDRADTPLTRTILDVIRVSAGYTGVKDLVGQYVKKSDSILMAGCGNSRKHDFDHHSQLGDHYRD